MIGDALLGHIRYLFVLGGDVAGEVVEVGSGVQRFRVGDRVCGLAVGSAVESNKAAEGAFQEYTVVREYFAAVIPAHIFHERACVLPLCLATAAYDLFHEDFLALDPPGLSSTSANTMKQAVIVTGEPLVSAIMLFSLLSQQDIKCIRRRCLRALPMSKG